MAKAQRKAQAKLAARIAAYEKTQQSGGVMSTDKASHYNKPGSLKTGR